MNTPIFLTSVALLAGVAARPIENDHPGDDLRELVRSPDNDGRQAFLGRIPSGFDSLNSLQLHDLHDDTHSSNDDKQPDGSTSPKLAGTDELSNPDPGLASPYMGPQRHLANIEQELGSPILRPNTPSPSSPAPRKTEHPRVALQGQDYSPMVVILVFSSLAALVLLGLAISVVYVTQLLRRTVLQKDVWRSIANEHGGEKGDMNWSEKEKVEPRSTGSLLPGGEDQGVIAAREVPSARPSSPPPQIKQSEGPVEDPDVMPLPENPPNASGSIVRNWDRGRNMALTFVGWTYDNWVTHFMIALFGWLGMFFGGTRDR